ncbi:MAG: phage minor head protein [Prevotellaceae bacterium]|nr:phage minor head protein [Prevotellaceae bacterium]
MMKTLHKVEEAQFRIEILEAPKIRKFIEAHAAALDTSFKKVEMSDAMRRRLERSNYIFSGMKTFHELNEAFPSLLDENGNRKPFERFLNDVQKIDKTYNGNYLRAEYNFVQASAQMAARWEGFMRDGDRYNLQYRTAGDKKVRPEHAALDRVTLPITDPFWETYCPPNGWNCRCTVVQVLKSRYPVTPHEEAMALGEEATGKDIKGIFRFNPGIVKKAVPDYNPYTIRRCNDCDLAKGKASLAFIPDNELCAACRLIRAQKNENTGATERILRYDETTWERTYVSPKDVGLVATQLERIAEATASNTERKKFNKEMRMCKVLADNGHDVEYLQGVNRPAGQTYDILFDGIKADLKCVIGGAGNIVKYAKKALTKQGGEAVVFEIPSHNPKYYEALAETRRKCTGRIFFYFMDDMELKEIK